jgi:hypothetical protein
MEYHGGKNLDGKPKITMLDVWEGRASQTAGGLKKFDLMINKKNRVVSRRKHELGIRNFTGFRAKLCDGDFDLSKFKPTYSAKYMPKKKKPPVLTPKERVQKMMSVRKTEAEMADTYKRFRERFKDIIIPAEARARARKEEPKKVETPRKLTKEQWVENQIELMPLNDKNKLIKTLKTGDKVAISYLDNFITGVVATKPFVNIILGEGREPAIKINIKTIDGEKPDPTKPNYKGTFGRYKRGLSVDLIDKISRY